MGKFPATCYSLTTKGSGYNNAIDWTLNGIFYAKSQIALQHELAPESARFVIERNELPVIETELQLLTEHWRFDLVPKHETPVTAGDTLTYCIDYTDSFGRKYRYFLVEVFFETDQNGKLTLSFVARADEVELT